MKSRMTTHLSVELTRVPLERLLLEAGVTPGGQHWSYERANYYFYRLLSLLLLLVLLLLILILLLLLLLLLLLPQPVDGDCQLLLEEVVVGAPCEEEGKGGEGDL